MSDDASKQRFATRVIHGGQRPDPLTGAVMPPIYATSTYVQSSLGVHKGYDYARTRNPTRDALQACLANLEGGCAAFAFASGMAASSTAARTSSRVTICTAAAIACSSASASARRRSR